MIRARGCLHETSPRIMAVLQPVKVVISNLKTVMGDAPELQVPDFPFDPSRGSHSIVMTCEVFVDASDIRTEVTKVAL